MCFLHMIASLIVSLMMTKFLSSFSGNRIISTVAYDSYFFFIVHLDYVKGCISKKIKHFTSRKMFYFFPFKTCVLDLCGGYQGWPVGRGVLIRGPIIFSYLQHFKFQKKFYICFMKKYDKVFFKK